MFMAVLVLANDIKIHLNDLNELILSVSNEELPRYMKINQKLCNIFELQLTIREFSTNHYHFNFDFYSGIFTGLRLNFQVHMVS